MSKSILVAAAIAQQLTKEKRWPPNNSNKTIGEGYGYDAGSLTNLLNEVRYLLAHANPPYYFSYSGNFLAQALAFNVATLVGEVDWRTKQNKPDNWEAP